MTNAIVINLSAMDKHILDLVDKENNSVEILVKNLALLGEISEKIALLPFEFDNSTFSSIISTLERGGYKMVQSGGEGSVFLLEALLQCLSADTGICYWFQGDGPFYDMELTKRMVEDHLYYGVQFSNGDGYPEGLTPEIFSFEILPALIKLAASFSASKIRIDLGTPLFDILALDINQFDIETIIAPVDTALMRLRLFSRGLRKSLLCKRLAPFFVNIEHSPLDSGEAEPFNLEYFSDRVVNLLVENQQLLRTRPAFYHIQITTEQLQNCSYLPSPIVFTDTKREMDPEEMHQIALKAKEFSEDAVLSLSLWGEPSMHSNISGIIDAILSVDGLKLLIETTGIGWTPSLFSELKEKYEGRIIWIITLDTIDASYYKEIRGDGFDQAFATAHFLTKLFPNDCYVQAVRIKEGEEQLEKFWEYWNREGNVLIQKYNHFCKELPERKVVELAPLKRYPCWHLKRDLNILVDGSVLVCREDYKGENIIGNIFTEELETIFNATEHLHVAQCRGEYLGKCGGCDEFYTFNF